MICVLNILDMYISVHVINFKGVYVKKELVIAVISAMLAFSGCGSSSNDSGSGGEEAGNSDTIKTAPLNATDGTKEYHFNLASGLTDDNTWQFAYQKYIGFSTKSGVQTCVAKRYDTLYDSKGSAVASSFKALNAANTLDDFNTVSLSDCNESNYQEDIIKTYIETGDWLSADYSAGAPVYAATNDVNNSWIIRSASGNHYARIKVKSVSVEFGATTTRKLVLSSELYVEGDGFLAAQDSPALDFSTSTAYWDLETNTLTTESDTNAIWDVSVRVSGHDYPIQVNGGASGDGKAGVGMLLVESTADVTDPASTSQVYKYFADSSSGAMSTPGSYGPLEYDVDGAHKMWPTFAVYILKDGEHYYKAQIISNYGEDGTLESGNLVIRYMPLSD